MNLESNGCYLFVIEGSIDLAGQTVGPRDAVGIWETQTVEMSINDDARLLFVEVPMEF